VNKFTFLFSIDLVFFEYLRTIEIYHYTSERNFVILGFGNTALPCVMRYKNPTPNPLPASDEGAKMYLIRAETAVSY
jgi:hypothetical protein